MGTVHTVASGESLSLIALAYGYEATDWPVIYDHPENASFRTLRPDPNVIEPGDQVFIPTVDEAPAQEPPTDGPTTTLPVQAGRRNRFRLGPQVRLQIDARDGANLPHAFCAFTVEAGGVSRSGTTDKDGLVDVKIPAGDDTAILTVSTGSNTTEVFTLRIGHLKPVDTTEGIQARLNNLIYDSGPVDGVCGASTQAAIRAFQTDHQLVVDGVSGPITQAKLAEVYGC